MKKLLKVQLAYFFKEHVSLDPDEMSVKFQEKVGDMEAMFTNIPKEAPPEIPRVILKDESKEVSINLCLNRMDVFWHEEGYVDDESLISKIDEFLDENSINVNRMGYVRTYFIDKQISEVKPLLSEGFLKQIEKRGELRSLTVRANAVNTENGIQYNNAEKFLEGRITDEDGEKEGIIIERDLNVVQGSVEAIESRKRNEIIRMFRDRSIQVLKYESTKS